MKLFNFAKKKKEADIVTEMLEHIQDDKEVRKIHEKEISDKIIPHLLDLEIHSALKDFSIQDTIVIQTNATWALKENILVLADDQRLQFMHKIEEIEMLIIEKLKNADRIYLIIDKNTNMPFLDNEHRISIFSEEKFANEAVSFYSTGQRKWEVKELLKQEIIESLTRYFYLNGAEGVLIDNGYHIISLKAEDVIETPDFAKLYHTDLPISNPEYLRNLTLFLQERNWAHQYSDKEYNLMILEKNMIDSFCNGYYLLPVRSVDKTSSSIIDLSKGSKVEIPGVTNGINTATPVFTDWHAFNKIYSQQEWSGIILSVTDLLALPEDKIVVNPRGINFTTSKDEIQNAIEYYNDIICKYHK